MSTETVENLQTNKGQPAKKTDARPGPHVESSVDPLSMMVNKKVIDTIGVTGKDNYVPMPMYMAMEDIDHWIKCQCIAPPYQTLQQVRTAARAFEKKHGIVYVSSNYDGSYFLTTERLKILWELGTKQKRVIVSSNAIVERVTVAKQSGSINTTEDGTAQAACTESPPGPKTKVSSSVSSKEMTKDSKKPSTTGETKETEQKARRGRPPGSKNKPKDET